MGMEETAIDLIGLACDAVLLADPADTEPGLAP